MNSFTKFFHELMNPHCPDCLREHSERYEERNHCRTCDALEMQLSIANQRITSLLNKEVEPRVTEDTEPKRQVIQTRHVPWHVKRQMLENESRAKAIANARSAKPDVKSEQGLEIDNDKINAVVNTEVNNASDNIKDLEEAVGISTH